jgi:hypothetical protein
MPALSLAAPGVVFGDIDPVRSTRTITFADVRADPREVRQPFNSCHQRRGGSDRKIKQKPNMLSAAGFKMVPADTPQKEAHLNSLPPGKLTTVTSDGKFSEALRLLAAQRADFLGSGLPQGAPTHEPGRHGRGNTLRLTKKIEKLIIGILFA